MSPLSSQAIGNSNGTGSLSIHAAKHLALFIPSLAGGGVARIMLHLADTFVGRGLKVDLVLCNVQGPYLDQVPDSVNVVGLTASPGWLGRVWTLSADYRAFGSLFLPVLLPYRTLKPVRYLPDLVRYLQQTKPAALLSATTSCNLAAVWARQLAGGSTRIVISERTTVSHDLQDPWKKWRLRWRFLAPVIRRVYPAADAITTVSDGVADDLSLLAHMPRERITTIYNPAVPPALLNEVQAPLEHPWFQPGAPPVILGAGRLLTGAKDFPTLLRAFARVRVARPARLMILGGGNNPHKEAKRRAELMALAAQLGIADDVTLPGFVHNPFAYMACASVFVLSSAWEGLPGVLLQALACGCPVVSTDCPSGPAEILENGAYGPLVPVGDDDAMARAILSVLETPLDRERLQARAARFSIDRAAERYLEVLLENQ